MKSLVIAAALPVMLAVSTASASPFQLVNDPSGAPMCADADGYLAPLSSCASLMGNREVELVGPFSTRTDPSGAPMCFAANGELAPLASCSNASVNPDTASFRFETDPSGAAMCFAGNGEQVPLTSCHQRHLVGMWSGLALFAL